MAKKSKLLNALDRYKGVDHELERQKKMQKQAERRKRARREGMADDGDGDVDMMEDGDVGKSQGMLNGNKDSHDGVEDLEGDSGSEDWETEDDEDEDVEDVDEDEDEDMVWVLHSLVHRLLAAHFY